MSASTANRRAAKVPICRGVPPWTPPLGSETHDGAPTEGRPYKSARYCYILVVAIVCIALTSALAGAFTKLHRSKIESQENETGSTSQTAKQRQPSPSRNPEPVTALAIDPSVRGVIAGGGGSSSGNSLKIEGTVGEVGAFGQMTGGAFTLGGGYWNTLIMASGSPTPSPSPSPTPTQTTIQFSASVYVVSEADARATLTVTRSGNTSSSSSFDYRTIDDPAVVRCDDQVNNNGAAYARCDYATSIDTLTFAPGETTRTFAIPIIDDAHVENSETFQVVLSNPVGASLGATSATMVMIVDQDMAGMPNPILRGDDTGINFFVRQHYLDFLAREPEPGEPWSAVLRGCANQFNTDPNSPSAACDRITVSGAFFGSPEFLIKGVYTIVFYRVSFGRLPQYAEFATDLRSVTGQTAAETNAKRAEFANKFVLSTEFTNGYGGMSNSAYVTVLMTGSLGQGYNLSSITTPDPTNPDNGAKVTLTTSDLINRLNAATLTRAQVLRAIVQSDQISLDLEAVNAFVASQYYGYLRRTPETSGFAAWVNYLRAHPNDFRTMVNGFLNSNEYRLRFGP